MRRVITGLLATGLLAAGVLLLVGCTKDGPAPARPDAASDVSHAGVGHVHGLGVNPRDGSLYAATHTGLFRIPADGPAERIADRWQDTMAFTVVGPDHFLSSGHPDLRDFRAGTLPAQLGLMESTDAGLTWQPRSLLGAADFHVLHAAHGRIYGYDSTGGAVRVSADGITWEIRSRFALWDMAVSPTAPDRLLTTTERGLQRSEDGGRTWTVLNTPTLGLLAWATGETVWAVAPAGVVYQSVDGGNEWTARGGVQGSPQALLVVGDILYVAVEGQGVLQSEDGGTTWRLRYRLSE